MTDHELILKIVDEILSDATDGAVVELICRRLYKAGYLAISGENWVSVEDEKNER